jgi:hypothetical protein
MRRRLKLIGYPGVGTGVIADQVRRALGDMRRCVCVRAGADVTESARPIEVHVNVTCRHIHYQRANARDILA